MALKGDRHEFQTDPVHFFMNETGKRGGIVSVSTAGSGAAMDQALSVVTYKASASGAKPIGILLQDVVDIDQTRQHINFYKDEVQLGSKVAIGRKGYWVTDQVASSTSPTAGDKAYLAAEGRVTPTNTGEAASPLVGRFLSAKDADGYITLSVDL